MWKKITSSVSWKKLINVSDEELQDALSNNALHLMACRGIKEIIHQQKIQKSDCDNSAIEMWIIEKAARIAALAHEGQKRKGDDTPYISHPFMVALKLVRYGFPDTVIAAALTHDVLEDTDYPADQLREELGEEVFEIVQAVTNDASLPWEEKKRKYIETVRNGPEWSKAVCLADKIHNLESLLVAYQSQWPDIWKRFNRGKVEKLWFEEAVLEMLKETWSHPMIGEYSKLLEMEKLLA